MAQEQKRVSIQLKDITLAFQIYTHHIDQCKCKRTGGPAITKLAQNF